LVFVLDRGIDDPERAVAAALDDDAEKVNVTGTSVFEMIGDVEGFTARTELGLGKVEDSKSAANSVAFRTAALADE
jgi:hypothetical protein